MFLLILAASVINIWYFTLEESNPEDVQELFRTQAALNIFLTIIFNNLGAIFRPKWYLSVLLSLASYVIATYLNSYFAFKQGNEGKGI
jgi:hypothetical protein